MTARRVIAPEPRVHRVSLAGLVTAAESGAPAAGARVAATGPVRREAVSRAGGLFWFEDLPAGLYEVCAATGTPVHVEVAKEQSSGSPAGPPPAWIGVHVVGVADSRQNGG